MVHSKAHIEEWCTGLAALDASPRCMLDDGARRVCELGIRLPDVVFCGIRPASKEHNYVCQGFVEAWLQRGAVSSCPVPTWL